MSKWSVIFVTKKDTKFSTFTESLNQLVDSVDLKRTEIVLSLDSDEANEQRDMKIAVFIHLCKNMTHPASLPLSLSGGTAAAIAATVANTSAEHIAVVYDNVLVSKNFLSKLTFCMDNYKRVSGDGPLAVVGPVSNGGSGPQRIGINANLDPRSVNDIQKKLEVQQEGQSPWHGTATLESFCFLFSKAAYNEIGDFNCSVNGDFTVIDWICRGMRVGWKAATAADVYAYRPDEGLPLLDWNHMLEQHGATATTPQKLGVLQRADIHSALERDIFVESLERSLAIADSVFVIDANSPFKIGLYLKEERPDLWSHPKMASFQKYARPFDEKRDWNELLNLAEQAGMDWVFAVDGDEVIENKVTRDYLEVLMHPVNPQIMGYFVHPYYFWDSPASWRLDSIWGDTFDMRLARVNKGQRITNAGVLASQVGYLPLYAKECLRHSSIRIKGYGTLTAEQRERTRDLHQKNVRGASPNQFDYLVNNNGLAVFPWQEDNTVSVYAPVNQAGVLLYEWMDAAAYFADEIVLGDGGIPPVEQEILVKGWGAKIVPIWEKPEDFTVNGFAASRNKVLAECTSNYILQLDIDEKIEDWQKIRRMMDMPTYQAWDFQVLNFQKPPVGPVLTSTTRLFQNRPGVAYWGYLHETIDDAAFKLGWHVGQSPTKVLHYGFAITSEKDMYKKMQKYLELNIRQMEAFPDDPRAYYNLALHLIEDRLIDDAFRVLKVAAPLSGRFPLPVIELAKLYLFSAKAHFDLAKSMLKPQHASYKTLVTTCEDIEKITNGMGHVAAAPGHCLAFFTNQPKQMLRIQNVLTKMEKHIESVKMQQLKKK